MSKIHQMRILLSSLTFVCVVSLTAQDFNWQGKIDPASSDGFYKVLISPDIAAKSENDFGDIRIYSSDNKEIPYIFESEKPLTYSDYFVEYKIVEKKEQTEWPYYTRIVLHNPKRTKISNIQLIIRNSDVTKSLKLSGSDDNKNWYVIKDGYRFHSMYSDETTAVIKIIDFPLSNYEYYEILIDDWKNNPIKVLKAGYFNTSVDEGKYTSINAPEISQLEIKDEKQTLVKVVYPEKYNFDKISVEIDGPEFYYRNAEIQVRDSALNKRKEYDYFFRTVADVALNSSSSNTWYFDNLKTNTFYFRIHNNDDTPLNVIGIDAGQLNHYLICKLEKSGNYLLKFGNNETAAPVYDLKYFKDQIPKNAPILKVADIKRLNGEEKTEPKGLYLNNAFIWVAIVAVVVLLLYMVTRMMKDMKAEKNT